METVVSVRGLCKYYDTGADRTVGIKNVSLDIERGEFVAVMGPSGSGKSTFMHVLGLLDEPSSGTYRFEGRDVAKLSDDERSDLRSRRLGFVFQSYNLLPRTSALENVELPMVYAGVPERERRRIARQKLDVLGIGGIAGHLPNQLSGGQQQRVAIARSLVNDPAIILADEPTGALDTRTSRDIMQTFASLNALQRMTVLLVTHEPDIAAFAGRLILFRDGEVVSDAAQRQRVPVA